MILHYPSFYLSRASYMATLQYLLYTIHQLQRQHGRLSFQLMKDELDVNNHDLLEKWLGVLRQQGYFDWKSKSGGTYHLTSAGLELADRLMLVNIGETSYIAERIV